MLTSNLKLTTSGAKFFFAVCLAATLAAAAGLAQAQPGGGGFGHGRHGAGMGEHGGMPHPRLLESVGATPEQKAQIAQIVRAAQTEIRPLREAQRQLHQQMRTAMAAPSVDANAVENLRQRLATNHDGISRRMTQAMVEASRVLSPEQRRQLAEKMEQRRGMMQRHRAEREALEGAPARRP